MAGNPQVLCIPCFPCLLACNTHSPCPLLSVFSHSSCPSLFPRCTPRSAHPSRGTRLQRVLGCPLLSWADPFLPDLTPLGTRLLSTARQSLDSFRMLLHRIPPPHLHPLQSPGPHGKGKLFSKCVPWNPSVQVCFLKKKVQWPNASGKTRAEPW